MFKYATFFIGLRYINAKRRHQFISFISGFSLLGMALGTLSLIVVLSVMNGFDQEIKQRILSVVPHGFINKQPLLEDWPQLEQHLSQHPQIEATSPYIGAYAMLSSFRSIQSVELQGVLPDIEAEVSEIQGFMTEGQMTDLVPRKYGIVLGSILAHFLSVEVGDTVLLTLPEVSITPAGLFPRVKRFTVVGVFQVGAQVDQTLALIHLNDAQKLLRYKDNVQGVRLKLDDIYNAQEVMAELKNSLDENNYEFIDWSQTQGNLFRAIKMEKRMVTVLLLIIVFVAALNIVTGLILMVADKRGDIAVLRTLGMTTRQIMLVFMVQGSVLGCLGILIGGVMGSIIAINFSDIVVWFEQVFGFYVLDPRVYFISRIPSDLRWSDVVLICSVGSIMSIVATWYPAYRAAQVEPAEVLRYE